MKYWRARKLSATKFKRFSGVKRKTFSLMVRLVKAQEKLKKKPGRPSKLIVEDQILIALQYLRQYQTYYHISLEWKLSESSVFRLVRKVENILIQSRKFSLPGKKKLLDSSGDEDLILMDVTETPIERPTKHQKRFYSGKQGEHTLKFQVVFAQKTGLIMCLNHEKGKTHDFKLFKNSQVKFHKLLKVIADQGCFYFYTGNPYIAIG